MVIYCSSWFNFCFWSPLAWLQDLIIYITKDLWSNRRPSLYFLCLQNLCHPVFASSQLGGRHHHHPECENCSSCRCKSSIRTLQRICNPTREYQPPRCPSKPFRPHVAYPRYGERRGGHRTCSSCPACSP